ncbi:MAG: DUF2993 domain-containing protein [Halanaerobiaceae bacterium]
MRRKRSLWIILFVFLLLFLAIELFLPGIANRRLVNILHDETDGIEDLEINLSSFPAFKILFGRIDHVSIRSHGLLHDHLYLERFNLNYDDIVLYRDDFVGNNSYLEAIITEDALNEYLNKKYPEMGSFLLEINPEQILLEGELKIFDVQFAFQISGNLLVNNRNQIYFVPDDLRVEEVNIPLNLIKAYIEEYTFMIDLQTLDIPIDIDEIKIGSSYILITGGREGLEDSE